MLAAVIQKKDCLRILPMGFRKAVILQPIRFVWDLLYVQLCIYRFAISHIRPNQFLGTAKFVYGHAVIISSYSGKKYLGIVFCMHVILIGLQVTFVSLDFVFQRLPQNAT